MDGLTSCFLVWSLLISLLYFQVFNLSERRYDISKLNHQVRFLYGFNFVMQYGVSSTFGCYVKFSLWQLDWGISNQILGVKGLLCIPALYRSKWNQQVLLSLTFILFVVKVLDFGWPDHLAPPLERLCRYVASDFFFVLFWESNSELTSKLQTQQFLCFFLYLICSIIKSIDSWLKSDPLHVVVVHCKVSKEIINNSICWLFWKGVLDIWSNYFPNCYTW